MTMLVELGEWISNWQEVVGSRANAWRRMWGSFIVLEGLVGGLGRKDRPARLELGNFSVAKLFIHTTLRRY